MTYLASAIAITALVTYLLRVLPITVFRGEIRNRWVRSFLHYTPYAVLTAMTIPAVFLATSMWQSGVVGFAIAVVLAVRGRSLMTVALVAASGVWVTEFLAGLL